MHRRLISLILLLLAGPLVGCSDDSDPPHRGETGDWINSPDRLVQQFQVVYETMDQNELAHLLHAQYSMPLQQAVADDCPDLGPTLERDEVLRIHERLFSRQPVTDPDHQPVPAAQSMAFQILQRQGAWIVAAPEDAFPGTARASYDVVLLVDRGVSESALKVQGTLEFHVAMRDSSVNGITRTYHQLRALTDLTQDAKADKDVVSLSFGRMLGLWR